MGYPDRETQSMANSGALERHFKTIWTHAAGMPLGGLPRPTLRGPRTPSSNQARARERRLADPISPLGLCQAPGPLRERPRGGRGINVWQWRMGKPSQLISPILMGQCSWFAQDNFAPFWRSARMYLTNIRSSLEASGKPHRMHHISRGGVSGDSTTTVLYSVVQHGQRNVIGAGFFIIMNGNLNVETR